MNDVGWCESMNLVDVIYLLLTALVIYTSLLFLMIFSKHKKKMDVVPKLKKLPSVTIIVPAYNEEKVIGKVIEDLKNHDYKNIIVIDDGSKDKTSLIAKQHRAIVLRHIINRGQGAALKTGIEYALSEGADIIITFDADGQHIAEDIEKLIKPIKEGKADIVLGSRFLKQNSKVPLLRKVFLKGGSLIFRILYRAKLTDSHNGLRAMSRKAAKKINITSDGMEHASEIVEEIVRNKLRYTEVPVSIQYTEYSIAHGQRTSNAFKILFKMTIKRFIK